MPSQSAKELVEELKKRSIEVAKLRASLNELGKEKEAWFKKREEHSKNIKEFIQKIKENKAKRDFLTQEVKELKAKRNSISKEIAEKLKGLGKLKKERAAIAKPLGIAESSSNIRQEIERLEFVIETEPMPFGKEQALMKRLKELKNHYNDACILDEADKKLNDAYNEISRMRSEMNKEHKLVQDKASQSQALHDEILKISAEIDKIKAYEEEAFKNFSEFKRRFNDVNSQLKEKLKEINNIKSHLDKINLEKREKIRQEQEFFLKSKEDEVNQKLKNGKKLTTDDLLVFQKIGKG